MSYAKIVVRSLTRVLTASRWSLAAPVLLMGFFWFISSIPGQIDPDDSTVTAIFIWVPPDIQNVAHVPAYALLGFLWILSLQAWGVSAPASILIGAALSAVYGVVDEWHQSFVVGRYASATDAVLNGVGVLVAAWICSRPIERGK